jgi:hypothetical protein
MGEAVLISKQGGAAIDVTAGERREEDGAIDGRNNESENAGMGGCREQGFFTRLVRCTRTGNVSNAHQGLKNKKKRQLAGVVLIVLSSTMLLINVAAFLVFPDKLKGTWLNVYVVGFNLDSVLSNIGILFICGGVTKRVTDIAQAPTTNTAAASEMPFEANSQATSVYSPSEAELTRSRIEGGNGQVTEARKPSVVEMA